MKPLHPEWEGLPLNTVSFDVAWAQLGEPRYAELTPEQREHLTVQFVWCMECNQPPFAITDIAEVDILQEGQPGLQDWHWLVTMKDSTEWVVIAWCDFTGWDCRSDAKFYKQA